MTLDRDGSTVSSSTLMRARHGDNDAWASIWRRYSDRVCRQCRRLGMSAREAEDVTVDVFYKVWAKLGSFSREASHQSLGAWIQTITERTAFDQHRARKRKLVGPGSEAIERLLPEAAARSDEESRGPSPAWIALWKALSIVENESSDRAWACFQMVRMQHLPQREVGELLGISPTNVSSTASRVYQKVREEAIRQIHAAGYMIDENGRIVGRHQETRETAEENAL